MKIGIIGVAGSGKDTAAGILAAEHGLTIARFAQPLHDLAQQLFGENALERSHKEEVVAFDYELAKQLVMPKNKVLFEAVFAHHKNLSPRMFMQMLGSEYFRRMDKQYFINLLKDKDNIVSPDVRFANEATIFDELILIECKSARMRSVHEHHSEFFALTINPKHYSNLHIIDNNGSILDLQYALKALKIGKHA